MTIIVEKLNILCEFKMKFIHKFDQQTKNIQKINGKMVKFLGVKYRECLFRTDSEKVSSFGIIMAQNLGIFWIRNSIPSISDA